MARLNALQSEDELRGYFPISVERAKLKVLDGLDRHCIDFIARSPFLCIGTSRPDGCADVSPRGDPPGFVHVADANTLPPFDLLRRGGGAARRLRERRFEEESDPEFIRLPLDALQERLQFRVVGDADDEEPHGPLNGRG